MLVREEMEGWGRAWRVGAAEGGGILDEVNCG